MEPYGSIKAEAQRWLGIAVKLLSARDLVGSKTFAIRAKESDHRLEFADQILAVADTLIGADKRINNQHDWYAILHIVGRTHDSDLIATQYNRLTHLLNPHQNNLPFADLAFKFVCDAWIVLSNPSSKSVYDSEINFLSVVNNNQAGLNREQEYHEQQYFNTHHQNQQWRRQQQQQQQQPPPLSRPVPYQPLPSRSVAKQPPPSRPVPQQPVQSRPEPQNQQQQPTQRVQEPGVRQSPRNVVDNTPEEVDVGLDNNNGGNVDESDTFWTTCPYCFNMYEYPRVYVDCTLRCQNCKRAFQAISIPMRPPVIEGKEVYFSCWGFFPMAITESNSQKKKDKSSGKWTPFSSLFTLPQTVENANAGSSDYVNVQNANAGSSDYVNAMVPADKSPAPRVYVDIDDAYLDDLEGDDDTDDDDDWRRSTTRKRAKSARGKTSSVGRPRKQSQSDKAKNIKVNAGIESSQGALAMKESLQAPKVAMAETSKKTVAINTRRQSGRGAKELGKLDLNVKFSNEVEEHAPASSAGNQNGGAGHREEDNIEGMFFEGLDEFLSNLPILVGDDKKAA